MAKAGTFVGIGLSLLGFPGAGIAAGKCINNKQKARDEKKARDEYILMLNKENELLKEFIVNQANNKA